MVKKEELKLTVLEAGIQADVGRGVARLPEQVMEKLNVEQEDVIEITGSKSTGAIVMNGFPDDYGLDVIRIDGLIRQNADASIGEKVTVRKAEVKKAKSITIAPVEPIEIKFTGKDVRPHLFNRVVVKDDYIIVSGNVPVKIPTLLGEMQVRFSLGEIGFVVSDTNPTGIVVITESTNIKVLSEPVSVKKPVKYEDIGGLKDELQRVREMIELPLRHPEVFDQLGIEPPKGVLLHGPPGTGKTLIARAVAGESGANFFDIAGPEIMSKFYGESEANLRKKFEEAQENAPSILFIDELDSLAPKREEVTGEVERRIVAQLSTLMDGLKARGKVIVIGATNRPNALDPALRRPGRFDREIEIGVPDQKGRKEILQIHMRNMPLDNDVDIDKLSEITYGFVGADLEALCKESAMSALRKNLPQISWRKEEELPLDILNKLKVTKDDFQNALKMVEPSAMREVLVEIPTVTWKDVGGLEGVKESLKEMVEWPLKNPKAFDRMGIKPPKGILLYGPPGTGKTLLAKAVANESGANFISIKGPEILNKWVGESEKKMREVFKRAKQVAPSIIFFDELDAVAPRRGLDVGTRVTENVVSQMLTEMSGLEDMHNVVVIGVTNRPDMLDPALLRPGRFDRQVLIPAPDKKSRTEIFKIHTKRMPLKGVDLKKLVEKTDGYSGADIEAICREAGIAALRENIECKYVEPKHFTDALTRVKPSITPELLKFYEKLEEQLKTRALEKKVAKEETDYLG